MLHSTTTPTPTQEAMPQKFRGHTLEILGVLSDTGGLTTREISDKTGIKTKHVGDYCRRGFRRGIFERKERWGWSVSPLGVLVLSIHTTTTTTDYTTTTQLLHKYYTSTTRNYSRQSRHLDISTFIEREDIEESHRVVVGVLADHFERTGEKYRYFQDEYDFAEKTGLSVVDIRPALAHLTEEGCIYVRREALGWKIGLKKEFVSRLAMI